MKAESGNLLQKWGKVKEEDIGVKTPMSIPMPARPSSSQCSPITVKLGGTSVASQRMESSLLYRIRRKSYASGMDLNGKVVRDALAVRISWTPREATRVDVEVQEGLGDDLPKSSSVREQRRDSTVTRTSRPDQVTKRAPVPMLLSDQSCALMTKHLAMQTPRLETISLIMSVSPL